MALTACIPGRECGSGRQRRLVGEAYKRAGLPWPEPVVLPEFDEFQAEAVMERSLPELIESDSDIRRMHQAFKDSQTRPEQFKTFQQIFEVVIGRWADGKLPLEGIEPWADFSARVQRGLAKFPVRMETAASASLFSVPADRWAWPCSGLWTFPLKPH